MVDGTKRDSAVSFVRIYYRMYTVRSSAVLDYRY